jgi:hypothetical protein
MLKTVTNILLFSILYILSTRQPDDGFYLLSQGKTPKEIVIQSGQKIFLGEKQTLKVQNSTLSSMNNQNTEFYLSVTIPYDPNIGSSNHILIVNGTAYRQNGSLSSQKEQIYNLHFPISGRKNAEQVADYFKTSIFYRKHPGHQLLVSFTPTKQEYDIAEDVIVTLRIKNVGEKSFSFLKGGRNRAARDNQYIFSAYYKGKQVGDIVSSFHSGGMAIVYSLKPGEVFEDTVNLSKWFAFDKLGMYQVFGSYYLDFKNPDKNEFRTIWEDYSSADFTVTIRQKPEDEKNL